MMFADDTKLYSEVATPRAASNLQSDLEALVCWADAWQLPFNEAKCKAMHIGRRNQNHQYVMRDTELSVTEVEKDLGVHIDSELKFRQHASAAVAKAVQMLAVIRRSFVLINECTLPLLYKTMVRPHLEYGNLVWGPFCRADQKKGFLERAASTWWEVRVRLAGTAAGGNSGPADPAPPGSEQNGSQRALSERAPGGGRPAAAASPRRISSPAPTLRSGAAYAHQQARSRAPRGRAC